MELSQTIKNTYVSLDFITCINTEFATNLCHQEDVISKFLRENTMYISVLSHYINLMEVQPAEESLKSLTRILF